MDTADTFFEDYIEPVESEQQDDPAERHLKELEDKVVKQKFFTEELETQKRRLLFAALPESQWCSQAGYIMSRLISLALDYDDALVQYIISERQVRDFLAIVHSVLKCFLHKYGNVMPQHDSDEVNFLMALLEVVCKLTSIPAGRDFFAGDEYGLGLIKQFASHLPALPTPSGNALRRALLLPAFNVFSRAGPAPKYGWQEMLIAFEHSIRTEKDITSHMLYLSAIINMVRHPPTQDFVPEFLKLVPLTTLEVAIRSEVGGVSVMASRVQEAVLRLVRQSRGQAPESRGQAPAEAPVLSPMVAVPCSGPCAEQR